MKLLPLGTSSFTSLRAGNQLYVDKTDLIFQLAQGKSKIFLARPRRFGKSLLVSTFESLFKYGLKDFQGLAIEKLWKDKTYNTVRLDFSEVKEFSTVEEFQQKFYDLLVSEFERVGFKFNSDARLTIRQLSNWFENLSPNSLVLLIDEYDAPLTACLDREEIFNEVRSIMNEFFLTLKSRERCLQFFFMTGITKFSNTSIFSAFNNLQDISLDPDFGTLLGYTEEEINRYFAPYLEKASQILGLSNSEVSNRLRAHYDGFCFDMKAETHVYCPWSVLNFFKSPRMGFQNYWYSSGGQPTVLMKYLTTHTLKSPEVYDEQLLCSLSDLEASRQYDEISDEVLLTQAGYLTIKEVVGGDYVRLGYPNEEVSRSMARLYAEKLLKGQNLARSGIPFFSKILSVESVDTVVEHFNQVFGSMDYINYPVNSEATCRAYLQVLLIGAALVPRVEVHNALGRSDMEVEVGNRHWVFEFKFAKDENKVPELLEQAVDQIKTRNYGVPKANKELIRVALVFSEKSRSFVAWKQV